jgi:hypothetical protein
MLNKYKKLFNKAFRMIKDDEYLQNQIEKHERLIQVSPEILLVKDLKEFLKTKIKKNSFRKCLLKIVINEDQSAIANIFYYSKQGKLEGYQYKFPKIALDEDLENKLNEAPPLEYEEIISGKDKKLKRNNRR